MKLSDYEMGYVHRAWWRARDAGKPTPSLDSALAECRRTRTAASRFQEGVRHPNMPATRAQETFEARETEDRLSCAGIGLAFLGMLALIGGMAWALARFVPH